MVSIVADGVVRRRCNGVNLHFHVGRAGGDLSRREFGKLGTDLIVLALNVVVFASGLPFAVSERLQHGYEIVLFLDAQLATWKAACEFLRLSKTVFEIIGLESGSVNCRPGTGEHTAWSNLFLDSGVDIPVGCWVSSSTATSFGRSSS